MSILSYAGGASEGLEDYLSHMLEEQKVKQIREAQQTTATETSRHNRAAEENDRIQNEGNAAVRTATQQNAADTLAQTKIRDAATASGKAVDDGRALGDVIPGDTFLERTDPAVGQMRTGGVGSLLKDQQEQAPVDVGPLLPGDDRQGKKDGLIKLRSSKQINEERDDTERKRHETAMENKPTGGGVDRVLIQSGNGWISRADAAAKLKDGKEVPLATTSSTRTMEEGAKMLTPHIARLEKTGEELDKRGLFGPVMSRVRHAAEKAGTIDEFVTAIGADPELNTDRLIGRFSTSLGLMATGAGRVHGGARGGGSAQMMEHFKHLLADAASFNMFMGRLDSMEEYMGGYAAGPGGETKEGDSGGLPTVGGTFQGGRVISITPVKK